MIDHGPKPGFLEIPAYLNLPRDRTTWLLKPLIPIGGAALIYANPKVGKTFLIMKMCEAISDPKCKEFLGFPVLKHGPCLYLQLDTPRSLWTERFEKVVKAREIVPNPNFLVADRESIEAWPFDILQPKHVDYLHSIIAPHRPAAVVIDTIREAHSGDEDSSTNMRNVIAGLTLAAGDAAVILISHSRKPQPDSDLDIMSDLRGSSYVAGRMDAMMRLTNKRLYYAGRSIEPDYIDLVRMDEGTHQADTSKLGPALQRVINDPGLPTLRSKARVLAKDLMKSEDSAMSTIRRFMAAIEARQGEQPQSEP